MLILYNKLLASAHQPADFAEVAGCEDKQVPQQSVILVWILFRTSDDIISGLSGGHFQTISFLVKLAVVQALGDQLKSLKHV